MSYSSITNFSQKLSMVILQNALQNQFPLAKLKGKQKEIIIYTFCNNLNGKE